MTKDNVMMHWTRKKAIMFFTDIENKELEKLSDEELFEKGRKMGFWKIKEKKDAKADKPVLKGCGKTIKLHPKVKAKCGDYVMSWDRNVYCDKCEEGGRRWK